MENRYNKIKHLSKQTFACY